MKSFKSILSSFIFISQFLIVSSSFALTLKSARVPITEAWLGLTCKGVVTPIRVWPSQYQDIVKFFIQVDGARPRPSLKDLAAQSQYASKFEQMTRYCTDRRLNILKKNVPAGEVFLDWSSEFGYSRFILDETFIPLTGACRNVGQPCSAASECCGFANPIYSRSSCDLNTNTCVNNSQSSESVDPKSK